MKSVLTAENVSGFCKLFSFGGVVKQFLVPYTKTLLLQLLLTQVSKDQISVSVKFTFPVGGDTTIDFKEA